MSDKWKIKQTTKEKEAKAEKALGVVGLWMAGQATRLVPKITSRLANSISSAIKGGKPQGANVDDGQKAKQSELVKVPNESLRVFIGTSVVYAAMIEFGDGGDRPPQSYLRKVIDEHRDQIVKFFAKQMRKK